MGNYYLYQLAQFLIRCLPLQVAYGFAAFLADCHYLLSSADRKAVTANMKVILGREDVPPHLVRGVFRNFGRYLAEFFTMAKTVNEDYVKKHVQIENLDRLNEALKQGKGCIMVSAHLGNWELGAAVFSMLKYRLSAVALPHKDPRVNQFFNEKREFFGMTVFSTAVAVRRCLEHLRGKGLVALLAERDFNHHGVVMDFLGKPTMIPKGAALFSIKTGAPILPAFFIRRENGDFFFRFDEIIQPPVCPDKNVSEEDIKQLIGRYLPVIEREIRKEPSQWLMFREFWI